MFILSISYKTADFEVKSSFNTLKLIFLPENVYLTSCMIYKNILIPIIKIIKIMYV